MSKENEMSDTPYRLVSVDTRNAQALYTLNGEWYKIRLENDWQSRKLRDKAQAFQQERLGNYDSSKETEYASLDTLIEAVRNAWKKENPMTEPRPLEEIIEHLDPDIVREHLSGLIDQHPTIRAKIDAAKKEAANNPKPNER